MLLMPQHKTATTMNINSLNALNLSEYIPGFVLQDIDANQTRTYIVSKNDQNGIELTTDNLKKFYESSGDSLERTTINNVSNSAQQSSPPFGNNLKLASFLASKINAPEKEQHLSTTSNIVLEPAVSANNMLSVFKVNNAVETITKRKDVKDHSSPPNMFQARILPKIKPKEESSKHISSVQLLKLGENYHSLNELNSEQMKLVNRALKNIKDIDKVPSEPTYDPVTNIRFVYKVVSPKDLKLVGNGSVTLKQKKGDVKKNNNKKFEQKQANSEKQEPLEVKEKVTRSGRKVKTPHQIEPEDTPHRPRKKNGSVVSCFQCSAEFNGLYRLQKHYENYPTHIPARIHSNLFHCLLAIVKGGSEDDRASIFVQQLEQLIDKIKSLLPCMLKKVDGCEGKLCNISDDIGRLFGMNPGKYNLNMDAVNCIKDKDGHCRHDPPKSIQFSADLSKPSQLWLSKHNEEMANHENETEDCARINSVDKLPAVSKRIRELKQKNTKKTNAKRMKLSETDTSETHIELGRDDLILDNELNDQNAIMNTAGAETIPNKKADNPQHVNKESLIENQNKTKSVHEQFHSTHFDIRSSPIKPSATVFNTFQIMADKISSYGMQMVQPLDKNLQTRPREALTANCDNSLNLQSILRDDEALRCKETVIDFENSKDWSTPNEQAHENYINTNSLIKPTLIHVKDLEKSIGNITNENNNLSKDFKAPSTQSQSMLNFLDSLGNDLTYSEAEIKSNSVDFPLDLFSLTNMSSDSLDEKKDSGNYSVGTSGEILQSANFALSLNPEH